MSAGMVVTVLGEIPPSSMGNTLSHDHVMVDGWGLRNLYEAILDDESIAIEEVARFKAAGGGTICDPTNIGLKRDPAALARISAATGVNIVMGAGWYREKVYPEYITTTSSEALAELLVREIEHGVDETGIRPGFIGEIGTPRRLSASFGRWRARTFEPVRRS